MRKLWIENEKGNKYDFTDGINCLASSLINFGIQLENTYFEYENSFKTSTSKMAMMYPSFNAYFLKGYAGYREFIEFAYRSEELKLYYQSDDTKYCYVDIQTLGKTELATNHALNCNIVFTRKSMWMKEYAVTIDTEVVGDSKSYDYSYDYRYIQVVDEHILATNRGSIEAPLNVTIKGPLRNPSFKIFVDNNLVSELVLSIEEADENALLEIISEEGKEEMSLTVNGVKRNVYQSQDFSKNSFLFLPLGDSTISINSGINSGIHRYILTYHELYRGN